VLEREGASLVEVGFPPSEVLFDTQRTIISSDAAAYHTDHLRERSDEIGADVRTRLHQAHGMSAVQLALARHRR